MYLFEYKKLFLNNNLYYTYFIFLSFFDKLSHVRLLTHENVPPRI